MGWVPGSLGPWETCSLVSDFRVKVCFSFFFESEAQRVLEIIENGLYLKLLISFS